jgi:hypothetical protein
MLHNAHTCVGCLVSASLARTHSNTLHAPLLLQTTACYLQVVLLQIFFSPRFVHVVGRLWRGPIFAFYCKLYMYFVGACWAFPATWTPALTRMTPRLLAAAGGSTAQQGVCLAFYQLYRSKHSSVRKQFVSCAVVA